MDFCWINKKIRRSFDAQVDIVELQWKVFYYSLQFLYMLLGYQREMTYSHDDGSYSAFGKSDKSGTTW